MVAGIVSGCLLAPPRAKTATAAPTPRRTNTPNAMSAGMAPDADGEPTEGAAVIGVA
jgi:hypothetical protein